MFEDRNSLLRFIIISVSIHAVFLVLLTHRINTTGFHDEYRINEIVVHLTDEASSGYLSGEGLVQSDKQKTATESFSDSKPLTAPPAVRALKDPSVSETAAEPAGGLSDMSQEEQIPEELETGYLLAEEKITEDKDNQSPSPLQNKEKDLASAKTVGLTAENEGRAAVAGSNNMKTSLSEDVSPGKSVMGGDTREDGGGILNALSHGSLPVPAEQPDGGSVGVDVKVGLKEYISSVKEAIKLHIYYPPAAKRSGINGRVVVSFIIRTDGTVSDVKVIKTSGHSVLDEASKRIIGKVSPLPPPPSGDIRIEVPVVFSLKR